MEVSICYFEISFTILISAEAGDNLCLYWHSNKLYETYAIQSNFTMILKIIMRHLKIDREPFLLLHW